MDIQILVDGAYQAVERNVDPSTPKEALKQLCEEMHGTAEFQVVYSEAEIAQMRSGAYQSELDGKLFDLLLDDVLPAFNSQLPEATQTKVLELLNQRAAIKAQYPKPAA